MDQNKKNAYITPAVIAAILVVLRAILSKVYVFTTVKDLFGNLSDCFLLPGVLLTGVALLGWIGTFGFFDILSYGSRSFFGIFIRPLAEDLPRTFYDYRVQKEEKGRKWSRETLIVGLIALGISVLLLIAYALL